MPSDRTTIIFDIFTSSSFLFIFLWGWANGKEEMAKGSQENRGIIVTYFSVSFEFIFVFREIAFDKCLILRILDWFH